MTTLHIRAAGKLNQVELGAAPLVVGRGADCDVIVPDARLSRRHCRIVPAPGGHVLIEDLGSKSGCFLGDHRLTEPMPMVPGECLRIGTTEITLKGPAAAVLSGDGGRDAHNIAQLLETVRAFFSTDSVDMLLQMILDRAIALAAADRGALLLADADGKLEVALVRDAAGNPLDGDALLSHHFPSRALEEQRCIILTDTEQPEQRDAVTQSVREAGLRAVLCAPLPGQQRAMGVLYVAGQRPIWSFGPADVAAFESLAAHGGLALERARLQQDKDAHQATERRRLEAENSVLKARLDITAPVGQSPAMRRLLETIRRVAPSDATVCLHGETGSGKEILARHLHGLSPRGTATFVVVDCGALPEPLIESELFGHERGAFTGALRARPGRFREADGGTIFLDEIGELPLHLQSRLLRVLQEKTVQPLGGNKRVPVDVRVLCATHRDLELMVAEGSFRQDLYYRLGSIRLEIPRLAERGEDVLLLARQFLGRFSEGREARFAGWTREAALALLEHPWPGNVRELEQCMQRAVLLGDPPYLQRADFGLGGSRDAAAVESDALQPLQEARAAANRRFERLYLAELLARTGGKIAEAAELAVVSRQLLWRLMRRHGLDKHSFNEA